MSTKCTLSSVRRTSVSVRQTTILPASCFCAYVFLWFIQFNKILFFVFRIIFPLRILLWKKWEVIWQIISENSTFCLLWYQSILETRRHKQSPRLRYRQGVWSPGAVLQLSVQEQPQSAPWCQPLLFHLPTGQLLPGARWLRQYLSQTTHLHRQLLRSGGWWVTVPYCRKMKHSAFSCTFLFLFCLLDGLLINSFGYTKCGRPRLVAVYLHENQAYRSRTTDQ